MYAQVIVDIKHSKLDRIFSYNIPDNIKVFLGSRVLVPFGGKNKKTEGYIIGFSDTIDFDANKVKDIIKPLSDNPEFTEGQIQLAYMIKDYYITTLVSALRLMFPAQMRGNRVSEKKVRYVKLILSDCEFEKAKQSLYSKQGEIKSPVMYNILSSIRVNDMPISQLTKVYPSANSCIKSMQTKGWVEIYEKTEFRAIKGTGISYENKYFKMTKHQQKAIDSVTNAQNSRFLLHGVTGSGKTEVYIKAIEHCINTGKTAIMLVPEISLTPQLISMFSTRLGDYIAVYHSSLSAGERFDEWRKINTGKAKVVIGPRSALFVPLKNIGLIILDEEHEGSYQADQHPKYKTHDIAKMRADIEKCNLVFASATPRVETYYEALNSDTKIISLPNRVHNIDMPTVYVEDMRKELRNGNRSIFSGRLYEEITKTLENKQQIILFVNRRGYSSFVMCRGCGHIIRCDNCDVSMTLHDDGSLVCHHCNSTKQFSKTCPECGLPYVKQFGIGTQQIEYAVRKTFPGAKTLRMDYDTTRTKNSYADIYRDFKQKKADILIGTQLVAKGLDFDDVTLVGAVAADVSLHFPDYQAVERTYSLLQQASGRAGRKTKGCVVIQTYKPEHYAIACAAKHDYQAFYDFEIKERLRMNAPPFGAIFRVVFSGEKVKTVVNSVDIIERDLKSKLTKYEHDILLLKSSPAPIKVLRSRFRYHIVIKTLKNENFLEIKKTVYNTLNTHSFENVSFGVEINPLSMF